MNVKVVPEQGEAGYYVAHSPALRSCWSQGRIREDAQQEVVEIT